MAISYITALRNSRLTEIETLLNAGTGAGKLKIYSGSAPADANAAASGTLLAELTLSDPAQATLTGGVWTADTITSDTSANATGTAGYFRATDSDDNVVLQGTVSTSGADLNLDSVSITSGGTVAVSSWTITEGNA